LFGINLRINISIIRGIFLKKKKKYSLERTEGGFYEFKKYWRPSSGIPKNHRKKI
jgi:hypothetical protein